MITALVLFKVSAKKTLDDVSQAFQASAPNYRDLPGLVRKYYVYGDDGLVGGVYLWEDRKHAEAFYDAKWRENIRNRFGSDAVISYFETPVIVDNVLGETVLPDQG